VTEVHVRLGRLLQWHCGSGSARVSAEVSAAAELDLLPSPGGPAAVHSTAIDRAQSEPECAVSFSQRQRPTALLLANTSQKTIDVKKHFYIFL